MANNHSADETPDNNDAPPISSQPRSTQVAPWANERRFDKLAPEQIKRLCREIADIQREQRELGLEQSGPALGPN